MSSVKLSNRLNGKSPSWSVRQMVRASMAMLLSRRLFIVRGPANSESVCLTFDDGPHPEHTPRLLDVLKQWNVRATFFVVGKEIECHPDLARRISDEGHFIGNHTFLHDEPGATSSDKLMQEVTRTNTLLRGLTGTPSFCFRPPHGKLSLPKLWSLWRAGQTIALWNTDPKDFACRSADELAQWFERHSLLGGDIVLMHDNHPHAADVLPAVIADVRARGLTFGTLADWIPGMETRMPAVAASQTKEGSL